MQWWFRRMSEIEIFVKHFKILSNELLNVNKLNIFLYLQRAQDCSWDYSLLDMKFSFLKWSQKLTKKSHQILRSSCCTRMQFEEGYKKLRNVSLGRNSRLIFISCRGNWSRNEMFFIAFLCFMRDSIGNNFSNVIPSETLFRLPYVRHYCAMLYNNDGDNISNRNSTSDVFSSMKS